MELEMLLRLSFKRDHEVRLFLSNHGTQDTAEGNKVCIVKTKNILKENFFLMKTVVFFFAFHEFH